MRILDQSQEIKRHQSELASCDGDRRAYHGDGVWGSRFEMVAAPLPALALHPQRRGLAQAEYWLRMLPAQAEAFCDALLGQACL